MSAPRVFDDIDRWDASPAGHSESHAAFLNRVHKPFWEEVRSLIEDWHARLCDDAQADVRARLRSNDNRQFHAAFWELYLHETLTRAGYSLTCHPELNGTTRRPDFLVEGGGRPFYLEATVASESDDAITAERRRARVYDTLDRLDSPNFFLWIDVEGEGTADLGARKIRAPLERWLSNLDPDEVGAELENTKDIAEAPAFEWEDEDWRVIFRAVPRSPESRGNEGLRPLGVFGTGSAYMVDDAAPLRKAIADKGSAYGVQEHPLVIAVRTSSLTSDEFDILNVLYGTSQVQFAIGPNGETITREHRAPDGYWFGGSEWRHRHVSGVLIANSLQPWTVADDAPVFWEHPDPEVRIEPAPTWRRAKAVDRTLEVDEAAASAHELLGLPKEWPPGRPWEDYPS